jgi:PiT family inorganic phosphate transporter
MHLLADIPASMSMVTQIFLVLALGLALGFEFVNGFHDTANAVATVIYTHTLKPVYAVVWSGCMNLLGVLTSTGTVAFGIVALLPVELVLNVGSGAGFAMVPGPARIEFPHARRLDPRRGPRQRPALRPRHLRGRKLA